VRLAAGLALAAAVAASSACGGGGAKGGKRLIVLGFDGMDHAVTAQLIAAGKLPNLARLAREGVFQPLGTAVPPQSPVAWSNFITGMDAGGHGIFDFIHRDPKTMIPYLSTSKAEESTKFLKLGKYQMPLDGGDIQLLRFGKPFWEVLDESGVETIVVRMPANFPPSGKAHRELSGMGTPDLQGTSGTFAFYTSELFKYYGRTISGGEVHEVFVEDGKVEAKLFGPNNPFLQKPQRLEAPFTVHVDPTREAVKLVVGSEERVLAKGEWSDWVAVDFEMVPTQHLTGIARFYLRQVRPELELYVTPLNIDPLAPALPISHPADYAAELAEKTGRYYTEEMPEETKALTEGIFTPAEFLAQAKLAGDPLIDQFKVVLGEFQTGLLFYYFGNLDQVSHMMWRSLDPEHPAYNAELDAPLAQVVPELYAKFDAIVGYALEHKPADATLVVMSDHGFSPWRRAVHLNSWLRDNGYLGALDPSLKNDPGFFANFDWKTTRAYALGLNGLYVNLQGREKDGIVPPGEREALLDELSAKLLALVDPATGQKAISKVYQRDAYFQDRGHLEIGPDLLIGYARTYRTSNESAVAGMTPTVFADNTSAWSGDHCMDHEAVPGVLFASRPLAKPVTSLKDLAAAILAEFGAQGAFPAPSSKP
jgi:predicted AlkP superfamily phosphohydrolase/phosphomutase